MARAPLDCKAQIWRVQKLLKDELFAVKEADPSFATMLEGPLPRIPGMT